MMADVRCETSHAGHCVSLYGELRGRDSMEGVFIVWGASTPRFAALSCLAPGV